MSERPVVVTGAHGFIGHALVAHLRDAGRPVRALVRAPALHPLRGIDEIVLGNLQDTPEAHLREALRGAEAVVHLAGRAHVLHERSADAEAYRAANVDATVRLAHAATAERVARFVFASTVKVNGEATAPGQPFRPDAAPAPRDAYARSKLAAEQALAAACAGTGTTPVILRLPLVYGPGVRGNFALLMDAVAADRRLPLGAIDNRRSVLGVANLCTAIDALLASAVPVAGVHFVADGQSVATPALVRAIGDALAVPARLAAVPVPLLRLAGALTGRAAAVARLTGSLEVDTRSLEAATGWRAGVSLAEELAATARWWRLHHSI